MQLWNPKSSHNISEAENWTPALFGALVISQTKTLSGDVRSHIAQILDKNRLNRKELLHNFLSASGKISFNLDDVIGFFYDKCRFEKREDAIISAMVLLGMRMHLENPGKKTGTMNQQGTERVKATRQVIYGIESGKIAA